MNKINSNRFRLRHLIQSYLGGNRLFALSTNVKAPEAVVELCFSIFSVARKSPQVQQEKSHNYSELIESSSLGREKNVQTARQTPGVFLRQLLCPRAALDSEPAELRFLAPPFPSCGSRGSTPPACARDTPADDFGTTGLSSQAIESSGRSEFCRGRNWKVRRTQVSTDTQRAAPCSKRVANGRKCPKTIEFLGRWTAGSIGSTATPRRCWWPVSCQQPRTRVPFPHSCGLESEVRQLHAIEALSADLRPAALNESCGRLHQVAENLHANCVVFHRPAIATGGPKRSLLLRS
eukprot:scaffold926_cov248-Pinguiococcus_pyrenoidosus.AAC.10